MEFETWIGTGRFFACAALDRLVERARDGDPQAWAILRQVLPADLPAELARSMRDDEIRILASDIRAAVPGISDNRLAILLGAFGDAKRRLARCDAAPELTDEEFSEFSERVSSIQGWAPTTKRGNSWPKKRQLAEIIKS